MRGISRRPMTPQEMLASAQALLDHGNREPQKLIDVAARQVEKWSRLVEEQEAGHPLDGRASIYTGETYAQARDRWEAYRGLLVQSLAAVDGGGH